MSSWITFQVLAMFCNACGERPGDRTIRYSVPKGTRTQEGPWDAEKLAGVLWGVGQEGTLTHQLYGQLFGC